MDISSSKCKCCLKRASERDLNCTYLQFDTGENYAEMIKECFNIELAVNTEDGICEVCISRLRDACDFKTQVQTCQRHFTRIENEEFDKEIPVHEEKLVIRNAESPVVNEELVIPDIDTVPVENEEKSDNNFLIVIEQMSNSCHEEDLSDADDVTYSQKKRKKKGDPKTKLYKCTYCNFKTDRRTDVKRHERTHTGEKPYKCDFCNFRFSQLGHLNVHQRMHTGEKPYKCAFCDLRSARASNIRKHEKLHNNGHQMKRLPLKKFVEPQTII